MGGQDGQKICRDHGQNVKEKLTVKLTELIAKWFGLLKHLMMYQ